MLVALETSGLYTTQAGVARYIRGLLRGLNAVKPADCEWFELAWPVENFGYRQPQRALKTAYRDLVWSRMVAPRALRTRNPDVFHATAGSFLVPPASCGHVVTLHDVGAIRHPERFRKWQRFSAVRRFSVTRRADKVICISRFTADEALRVIHLDPRRIEVVYNGCDFSEGADRFEEAAPEFPVPSEFILFVGSLEPGKNLALLREAYALASDSGAPLPPLLIVGARWQGVSSEGPPPNDWHYLGRQPDAVLIYLYRRALALAFPSKYEGFGLPVAEAMALGCPVICSRVASLPEVGGDAALYSDLTPEGYREAIRRVAAESELRNDLQTRGRDQARRFTWSACARGVLDVYRSVLRA